MLPIIFANPPVPVTCIERAKVSTKALFNSSDSAETNVFGSFKNLESCGCTSADPKPVINLKAVLSTLQGITKHTVSISGILEY